MRSRKAPPSLGRRFAGRRAVVRGGFWSPLLVVGFLVALTPEARAADADKKLRCPAGARKRSGKNHLGEVAWCVRGHVKHGPYKVWSESGKPFVLFNYRRGVLNGRFRCWYKWGGSSVRGSYREGMLHGPFQLWHNSGTMAERGQYKNGQRSGSWTFYWLHGKRDEQGSFVEGERHGRWKRWDKKGKPEPDVCFDRGREVACK